MISLYDSIEVGDTITMPTSFNLVKSGVVESLRKWNGSAMQVRCTNGAKFEISRYKRDYVITVEESN